MNFDNGICDIVFVVIDGVVLEMIISNEKTQLLRLADLF